jgi:hypothetical protein
VLRFSRIESGSNRRLIQEGQGTDILGISYIRLSFIDHPLSDLVRQELDEQIGWAKEMVDQDMMSKQVLVVIAPLLESSFVEFGESGERSRRFATIESHHIKERWGITKADRLHRHIQSVIIRLLKYDACPLVTN